MTMTKGQVTAIIGGQLGSEGKGAIVAAIAHDYDVHVRVGAPNAGHTFKWRGNTFRMKSIPVGWCNTEALLVIGRGALVNPELILTELAKIEPFDSKVRTRLKIDARAGVLDPRFKELEGGIDGEMHERIGSTGEGVGPAREARISRNPKRFKLFGEVAHLWDLEDLIHENTPDLIQSHHRNGKNVLLEGSQGVGLSLIHGPWPYVTSTDCGTAQMCADIGIPINMIDETIAVLRTYPIRVAGNSGPLKNELTWEELSKRIGHDVVERTTVTQKIRRVGEWDIELAAHCKLLNKPELIAITFIDYIEPESAGVTDWGEFGDKAKEFIQTVENYMDAPAVLIGTGGENFSVVDRRPTKP